MNNRQIRLIQALYNTDHYTRTVELARELDCSERTIRTDIKAIQAFFSSNNLDIEIESKRGNGLKLNCNEIAFEKLSNIVDEHTLYLDNRLNRFYTGVLLLACDTTSYTIDKISKKLFTNKRQIQDDLRYWENLMKPFGLKIQRDRHLKIVGPELNIRFFLIHYLYEFAPIAMKRTVEPKILNNNAEFLFNIIDQAGDEQHIQYTDNGRHQIAVYLQISAIRIQKGYSIEYKYTPISSFANAFCDSIEEYFNITLSLPERGFISDLLAISTRRWTKKLSQSWNPTPFTTKVAHSLLKTINDYFKTSLPSNLTFPLTTLLEASFTHKFHGMTVTMPSDISMAVHYQNMSNYMYLTHALSLDPELKNYGLFTADYTRLGMLLSSYIEQEVQYDSWRVGLVINCGIEMVFYAQNRVKSLLQPTRVVEIYTEDEVQNLDSTDSLDDIDFLITFEPIDLKKEHITISNAFTEKDIINLNNLQLQIGCPKAAQYNIPLRNGLTYDTLFVNDNSNLAHLLYTKLIKKGAWSGSEQDFTFAYEANHLSQRSWIIVTILSDYVELTDAYLFNTDSFMNINGEFTTNIAVLLVSPRQRASLKSITQKFKDLIEHEGFFAD